MTEPAGAAPASRAVRSSDILLIAAMAGLAAGLVEVGLLAVAKFGLHRFTHLNPQVAWMAPTFYTVLFTGIAAALLLVFRRASRAKILRIVAFLAAWIGGAGILFLYQRLHKGASFIVAAGLATQVSLLVVRQAPFFVRLAKRIVPPMVAIVVLTCAVLNLRWAVLERRALAQLPPAPAGAPNVLLIIWDTVRAASLSLYGYERETTPTLERLAERSIVFDRAFSTAPWTTPSHASIFTGLYPPQLSADWARPLNEEPRTLAEVLSSLGYRTGGFTANTFATARESGLARGFSHYEDFLLLSFEEFLRSTSAMRGLVNRERWRTRLGIDHPMGHKRAAVIEGQFLRWLDRDRERTRPFFAFVNLFDAHAPYLPPPPFDTLFGPRLEGRDPQMWTGRKFTPRELQAEIDAYDGAIAELDDRLGRLLKELNARGLLDNTLVILTADHGEEFGEHGVFTHGHSLYDRVLHVPLVIHFPAKLPQGVRVQPFVSLRDLPATVLDILGFDDVDPMPGASLLRYVQAPPVAVDGDVASASPGTTAPDTLIAAVSYASGNPPQYPVSIGDMRAAFADPLKLILNGDGTLELYDLRADPDESRNLVEMPDFVDARDGLHGLLEREAPQRRRRR